MYAARQYKDGNFLIRELADRTGKSWLKVCPERGGIILGFGVEGQEVFYLDPATFHQPEANVRGGVPILFPISGQLDHGIYTWNGQTYRMKNHGFARNLPWEVMDESCGEDQASMTLRLVSNDITRECYPFDFELLFTYVLNGSELRIEQKYANLSGTEMPMYPGFHPYFQAGAKNIAYRTDARSYYDYNDGETRPYEGSVDLAKRKESVVFLDAVERRMAYRDPVLQRTISMEYGEEFRYVVLWTEAGKPFLCVEPWMARTGEFHRGEELVMLQPGQSLGTFLSIAVQPN
jgi:galactose mutarotase-like enzyme